ncbi:MAG: transporter substrate-binding domain-containing protein [Kordiimonadaceae bacterium]|nr:transporter substrate-binding domain-containing protein [Kordiimonadaceae bacterium]
MVKRINIFFSLLFILLMNLPVCVDNSSAQTTNLESLSANLTTEEKLWIDNHPVVTATNELDWPPLDFMENGKPTGFSIEYLNLVAQKTGLNIQYVNGSSWNDLISKVENKENNITHALAANEQRYKFLNFTDAYLRLPQVYYGREDADPINSTDDLKGKKIALVSGTAQRLFFMNNYPDLDYIDYEAPDDALVALINYEVDVYPGQTTIANYIISKNLIFGVKVIGQQKNNAENMVQQLRLAAHKDEPILIDILNRGMAAITEPEYMALTRKWQTEYNIKGEFNLTTEEQEWLSENNVIKVAADQTAYPLVVINENNQISGISGDYLKLIAEKLNIRFEWTGNELWSEGLEDLGSGAADMIASVARTAERESVFDFTKSYLTRSFVIYAREGGIFYANMDALAGKKLVQVKGHNIIEKIRQDFPKIEIIEVDTAIEALEMLSNGDADAYVAAIPTTSYYISFERISNVMVVGDTPYESFIALGIRPELNHLSNAVQKAMISITDDEKTEINRKWVTVAVQAKPDYTLLIVVISIAVFVVLIILLWANSLRREVSRRVIVEEELNSARKEAVKANAAKSTFLANMSHEIRTPLNAIIGFSEVIISGVFGEIKVGKHKEYLHDIKHSGEHLSSVINDILDLSKIEAGKWQLEETDFEVEDCINEAIRIVKNIAEEKNISISLNNDQPTIIKAELYAIKRAVINLLSNSLKFTDTNGKIDCSINNLPDGSLNIIIKDNGRGIPAGKIEHVLSPFGQDHEVQHHNQDGTGLGLPIVKQLIELHDGIFTLESDVNVGTTATINLPISRIMVQNH